MLKATLQIFVAALLVSPTIVWGEDAITTFYIVRHAERADSTPDSDLSDTGIRRAVELYDVLRNVPLSAIYSTDLKRTKKTVEPIAEASRLELTYYPTSGQLVDAWATELLDANRGTNVVIVGHSGSPDVLSLPKTRSEWPIALPGHSPRILLAGIRWRHPLRRRPLRRRHLNRGHRLLMPTSRI